MLIYAYKIYHIPSGTWFLSGSDTAYTTIQKMPERLFNKCVTHGLLNDLKAALGSARHNDYNQAYCRGALLAGETKKECVVRFSATHCRDCTMCPVGRGWIHSSEVLVFRADIVWPENKDYHWHTLGQLVSSSLTESDWIELPYISNPEV